MIKIDNVEVYGWEAAIRGARNPMNSWDKSDSCWCCGDLVCSKMDCDLGCNVPHFVIGKADLKLMKKLAAAGSDHRKFMRMISVTYDITAPMYWWKEFDTYKVGTVRNSCSTMHTITNKEFTLDDFSHDKLNDFGLYNLNLIIEKLNYARNIYVNGIEYSNGELFHTIEPGTKEYWYQIIQLLPSSYNQKATVQLNYEVLANIYHSRKNHKLDEWREFCSWIETLPYSELITGGRDEQ